MSGPVPPIDPATLRDIGDGLAAQLTDLANRPTAERAERCALNLQGAAREVLRFRERLLAEGAGDGQ